PDERLPKRREPARPEVIDVRRGAFGVRGSGDTSGYGGLVRRVALPGGTEPPYGGWFDEVAERLEAVLGEGDGPSFDEAIEKVVVDRGEITFFVRPEHLD